MKRKAAPQRILRNVRNHASVGLERVEAHEAEFERLSDGGLTIRITDEVSGRVAMMTLSDHSWERFRAAVMYGGLDQHGTIVRVLK